MSFELSETNLDMGKRIPAFLRKPIEKVQQKYQSLLKTIQNFLMWVGATVSMGVIVLIAGIIWFFSTLPNLGSAKFADLRARAEQRVQAKMTKKSPLHWVSIDRMNRELLYSLVMSEDSTFFEHEGVNFDAMISATLQNMRTKKYDVGASTLSQQVVKNIFLTNEKSVIRKLKEVLITRRLEARFSKNEILELYMNLAEFGPDLYGIDAAARHYFRKKPSEINAAEGAFLALMLPSPRKHHFSIFENQNIAFSKKKKLRRILGDMLSQELITPKQHRNYLRYDYFPEDGRVPARK